MNHVSKIVCFSTPKTPLLTLLVFSLSTCAPTMYAADEHTQVQSQHSVDAAVKMTKLTEEQTNTINIAAITLGGVLLAAALITATIVINKRLNRN